MGRIIAIANQKGGVAKTTSTINIGACLALTGRKVLLIDIDPQGSLTSSLGLVPKRLPLTLNEVLRGLVSVEKATLRHEAEGGGYDFIPANIRLEGAEVQLAGIPGAEVLLREALEGVEGRYDYILIDAPPRLSLLTTNALTAANEIFIPLQAEYLALNGVSLLTDNVALIKKRLNPRLEITGVFCTRYDSRRGLNKAVAEEIGDYFGGRFFTTRIRDNVALAEAPSYGKDIFEYRRGSNGARDYAALTDEIIAQEGR